MAKTKKFYEVNKLENKDFKRIVGVNRDTFNDMVKELHTIIDNLKNGVIKDEFN